MTLVFENLADEAVGQLVTCEVQDAEAGDEVVFVCVVFDVPD